MNPFSEVVARELHSLATVIRNGSATQLGMFLGLAEDGALSQLLHDFHAL
jgi:hypothetical protein